MERIRSVPMSRRAARLDIGTERIRSIFDKHGFTFVWSYGEMAILVEGLGFDWSISKTAKCIKELVALTRPHDTANHDSATPSLFPNAWKPPSITITSESADSLSHLSDASVA